MRNAFVKTLIETAEINNDIVLITGDLGFGVLNEFWEKYPKRFINSGISEQNMASVAAGMALEGKNVFTYSIGNFPTLRCLEQIRNDVAYHKANVKIVAVGGGFSYGALGMSHHATEDIAIMRALPDITIFSPCDPIETKTITKIASEMNSPCYIRLGKGGEKNIHEKDINISVGKAVRLHDGKDIAIFVTGAIAYEVMEAVVVLEHLGISCLVYSFPTVKPIDKELIESVACENKYIFTVEEHNIVGGFGSAISEVVSEIRTDTVVCKIGINDTYTSEVGSQIYLRKCSGIDKNAIVDRISTIIK